MILSAADIADPFSFSDMKNAKFKLTEGDKVLLAMKTANLCSLVYSSTAVDGWKAGPVEEDGLRLLDISDYKVWTYTVTQEKSVLGHSYGSLAATGLISNVAKAIPGPIPFICFRGTYTLHDVRNDLASMSVIDIESRQGTRMGKSGLGMFEAYRNLRDLDLFEVQSRVNQASSGDSPASGCFPVTDRNQFGNYVGPYDRSLLRFALEEGKKHNGLIISGHSLGGAMATLLAAELWTDYQRSSNNFPFHNLHVTTFGAPRVFDDSTARDMFSNFKPANFDRYVNYQDVITRLGSSYTYIKSIVDDPSHGKAVSLAHCAKAHFHHNNELDWLEVDSEDVHDWVQPLLYSELFGMMQFFQQNGDPHSLVSGSGYLAKLKYSVTYQREIQTLEGAMRESFERLPICEIPKHWSSDLLDCFSSGSVACFEGFCCTSCLYGAVERKLSGSCQQGCCFCVGYFCLSWCCMSWCLLSLTRRKIREKYGIGSSNDSSISMCCWCCSIIQELTQLDQDPLLDTIPVFRKVEWRHSLMGVSAVRVDSTCLLSTCLPCVQFGLNAAAVDKSFTMCCCAYLCCCPLGLWCIPQMEVRSSIRQRYNIKGHALRDICSSVCCYCLSLSQEARQLQVDPPVVPYSLRRRLKQVPSVTARGVVIADRMKPAVIPIDAKAIINPMVISS